MPPIRSWAVGTDEFPRSERKPLTGGVSGEWRPARTSFCVQDKSRSEGRLFGSQGQMPPMGSWTAHRRSARASFRVNRESHSETAWTANGGRHGQSFHVRSESRSKGRLFVSQGQMPPMGRGRFANRQVSMLGMEPVRRGVHPAPGGECGPPIPNRLDTNASTRPYPTGTIRRSPGDPEQAVGHPSP